MPRKTRFLKVYFVCFFIALFSFVNTYKAINANSESGSGSFECHSNCNDANPNVGANTICESWKYPGIYVKLVYYDPSGTPKQGFDSTTHQRIIAGPTKVYPIGKNYGAVPSTTPSPFGSGNNNWLHTEWVAPKRYIDFHADQFVKDTVVSNSASASTKRNQFIIFLSKMVKIDERLGIAKANSKWNIDLDSLNEPSCEVDLNHHGNCYGKAGYRLVAELYLGVATNGGTRPDSYVSAKELRDRGVNGVTDTSLQTESRYMSIRWSDINYACNGLNGGTKCTNTEKNTRCLLNKNCGYGVWIVDISSFIDPRNYDYRLDMACNNCDSLTNKSIVIQDTTDWEDITASSKVTKKICGDRYDNIKKYFKKATIDGADVFCREEYHVTYPNAKNSISILAGRYFTVNEIQENLNKIDSTIPNFAPIEVERIRECRDTSDGVKLSLFDKKTFKQKFLECIPGKITLNYNDKTYKYKGELDYSRVSFSSNINGNSLIQRVKYSYRLKQDVFRYVRVKDGYSLDKRPNDLTDNNNAGYKDLLVSNLPVSLSSNAEGNTIKFKYELPTNSTTCDTFIKEVYDKPDYLSCTSKKEHDFYKQDNPDNLKDTACAKLYNTTDLKNKRFENCVNDRVKLKNPMGNCEKLNYMCDLKFPDGKPTVCSKDTAGKKVGAYDYSNLVWDGEGKTCCEKGTIYASKSGKCCDPNLIVDGVCKSQPGTCNKENHKKLGRDWNENENKCCPVNYKYNVQSKKCEPPADEKCKSLGCEACCYDENNNSYCGTILNGKVICPGKPSVRNIVYRTIDTSYPFTSQNGNLRNTGKNWCSNSSISGIKSSCSGSSENNTVSTVITDKKGLTEENAMYKIHLDSNSISEIRKYNSKNSYDDFTLECNNKGDECLSNFIRNFSYGELTGKCSGPYFGNC